MADPSLGVRRLMVAAEDGQLEALCRRHRVRLLVVFGSAAGGDATPRDLDVAVMPDFMVTAGKQLDVLGLLDELVALTDVEDIDLLDLGRAGPVAHERALVGTIPLFESEPGLYARTQMAAILERMDTDWMRRLDLALLAE